MFWKFTNCPKKYASRWFVSTKLLFMNKTGMEWMYFYYWFSAHWFHRPVSGFPGYWEWRSSCDHNRQSAPLQRWDVLQRQVRRAREPGSPTRNWDREFISAILNCGMWLKGSIHCQEQCKNRFHPDKGFNCLWNILTAKNSQLSDSTSRPKPLNYLC